jgi:predicted membrane protein
MENEMKNSYRSGYSKGFGFGIVLILVGVLFLGFNFGFLPIDLKWIVFSWPMIFVALGVINWIKRKPFSGTILLLIGAFFLVPRIVNTYPELFPYYNGDFTAVFWPILLILAGLLLVFKRYFGDKFGFDEWKLESKKSQHNRKYVYSSNSFSKNSVFGSGEHIILEPEFSGGELNAVFGSLTLDLRKTNLPEGETLLEINAVFGEIKVLVPDNWLIESHVDAVFGEFEDKRRMTDTLIDGPKLLITGACVFGSAELRT